MSGITDIEDGIHLTLYAEPADYFPRYIAIAKERRGGRLGAPSRMLYRVSVGRLHHGSEWFPDGEPALIETPELAEALAAAKAEAGIRGWRELPAA